MASSIKRRVALKGQSRSKFCGEPIKARSKVLCLRLAGHKKAHRATTLRVAKVVLDTTGDSVTVEAPTPMAPKVNVVKAAASKRLVAAPAKRARRSKGAHKSGRPSARLA